MEDNQKLKVLHETLVKDNYELPDYNTFASDLRDPAKSKAFYDALMNDKYELPDYETFSSDLGLKKKDVSEYGLPSKEVLSQMFGNLSKISSGERSSRKDGTEKGEGFLGVLDRPDGYVSTELSIGVNIGGEETEIPTLIPTLTSVEKDYLLTTSPDKIFTDDPETFELIKQKAIEHATQRISQGKSPFADKFETPDLSIKSPEFEGPQLESLSGTVSAYLTGERITDREYKGEVEKRISEINQEIASLPKDDLEYLPAMNFSGGLILPSRPVSEEKARLMKDRDDLKMAITSPDKLTYILGRAYNQSIIGLADAIINGEARAPEEWLEKYDAGTLTDVTATALGFMLDMPFFGTMGKVGAKIGVAAAKPIVNRVMGKSVEKLMAVGIEEKLAKTLALKGAAKISQSIASMSASGTALGSYGAVGSAMGDWAQPDASFDDIKWGQAFKRGAKDYVLGTSVGGLGIGSSVVASKASTIPSAVGRVGAKVGAAAGGLTAESALFTYGGALLEGRAPKDVTGKEFLETVALLSMLKLSHVAGKIPEVATEPKKAAINLYKSLQYDPQKPGQGRFEVDIQPWEIDAMGGKDYKSVMDIAAKDDAVLGNILKSEKVPALLKQKLLWGARGVAMKDVNIYGEKAVPNEEFVDIYNKEDVLVDKRKYTSKQEAEQASLEIGLQLEDNMMQMRSAEPDVDRINIISELKSKGTDVDKLLIALDKPVKDRTIEESKMVGDYYKLIPKPEKKSEAAPKEEIATEEVKVQTPEEIAKENDIKFIGKQEGVEKDGSDAMDMYNVKIGEQEATFTVPSGSDAKTVIEKRDAKIKEFETKPAEVIPEEVKKETKVAVTKKLDKQSAIKEDKIFKEQKNQLLDDLIGAEDILLGANKEQARRLEEEWGKSGLDKDFTDSNIPSYYEHKLDALPKEVEAKLNKLGIRVKDGKLVVDIYKDGTVEVGDIRSALRIIDKGFPMRIKEQRLPPGPGKLGKSQFRDKAESYGSLKESERRVALAEANLAEAKRTDRTKKVGDKIVPIDVNKKLVKTMEEQLIEAKSVHEEAKNIGEEGYNRIAKVAKMDADKEFMDLWEANRDQFDYDNLYRENLFDIIEKQGRPEKLTYDTVQPLVIKDRLETEKKAIPEKRTELTDKLKSTEDELKVKFGRVDGTGLKKPKNNNEEWQMRRMKGDIDKAKSDLEDLNKYEPAINKLYEKAETVKKPGVTPVKGAGDIVPAGTEADIKPIKAEGKEKPIAPEPAKVEIPVKEEPIGEFTVKSLNERAVKYDLIRRDRGTDVIDIILNGMETGLAPEIAKIPKKEWDQLRHDAFDIRNNRPRRAQEEVPPIEKKAETPVKIEGIKFKDKNYQSVDAVLDAIDRGGITFDESKQLREDVGKFEEGLKTEAKKKADDIGNRIDKGTKDVEDQIKKDIDDENSKLHLKLFPDLISKANTSLYKQLVKVRDGMANVIAGQLKKGVTSQNDGIRWSTKVLTNLYGGLLRTQADMFGTGEKGHIGKMEMSGTVKSYAQHKAFNLLKTWRDIVNSDPESLRRTLDVLDPDPEFAIEKLVYGDLSLAEKKLYFTMREWNTWVHETNYANEFLDTPTYLKFKDVTGDSKYIARMYDKYEGNVIISPEIQEFISRGNSAVTTKMFTDMFKMREEADAWKKEHAIRDPAYLTAKRVMQTIQNVAIKQYMDAVIAQHPEYVVKVKRGEDVPKGFTKLGASYSWGPFRNRAVVNHVVEDFTGFFYQNAITNAAYDVIKMVDRTKLTQFYKKFRTVYNPFVQTGNVTGNVFFASINGINPFAFTKGMIENRNLSKTNPALYESLLKSGLLGPVAFTGEIKPMDLLKGKTTALGKADELATRAYVGADNLAKISAYQIFRRQGLTHEQAVRRAYDSFQNYSTVGKTWDVTSKIPLIGPTFVKFQADLQRILVNNMLTTPITTIGTLMMIKMLGNLSSALSGETEEEQKIRESRKGVAKIPFVNIPLSFKFGKAEINVARYLSPLYMYNRGDSEMDITELSKFMPLQLQKRKTGGVYPAFADATWGWAGSVFLTDKDFRNVPISDPDRTTYNNPNTPKEVKIWNSINYALRSQVPFYKGTQDIINAATGQLDYYGRKRTWQQSILNQIVKIQQFDKPELKSYVERNLSYLTNKYASLASSMGDAQRLFYKTLQNAEDKELSEKAQQRVYESATRLRDKSIDNSLDDQIPIYQEIERLTNVYKKWHPEDEFIDKNFQNIESGKNRRFNVLSDIDLHKKHPEEYNLLKKNNLLKKPTIPAYWEGRQLTDAERKTYANIYWSEYMRNLDMMGLTTQEEMDEAKQTITNITESTTQPKPKEVTTLQEMATEAASSARDIANSEFR